MSTTQEVSNKVEPGAPKWLGLAPSGDLSLDDIFAMSENPARDAPQVTPASTPPAPTTDHPPTTYASTFISPGRTERLFGPSGCTA